LLVAAIDEGCGHCVHWGFVHERGELLDFMRAVSKMSCDICHRPVGKCKLVVDRAQAEAFRDGDAFGSGADRSSMPLEGVFDAPPQDLKLFDNPAARALYGHISAASSAQDRAWRRVLAAAYEQLTALDTAARLEDLGDLGGARAAYERIVDEEIGDWSKAALRLGTLLENHGDKPGAAAAYARAATRDTHAGRLAAFSLGLIKESERDLAAARRAFEQARGVDDANIAAMATYRYGSVLQQQGDFVGAEGVYRRVLETGNKYGVPDAAANLGALLYDRGEFAKSAELSRIAIDRARALSLRAVR
jgi:tetratricopeptide (TPR) repeat protein